MGTPLRMVPKIRRLPFTFRSHQTPASCLAPSSNSSDKLRKRERCSGRKRSLVTMSLKEVSSGVLPKG